MTTTPVRADALQMARNAARFVAAVADMQASDDPEVQIQAHIAHAGKQGMDSAIIAGMMALVSIAESLDRLADTHGRPKGPSGG